jgi:hypothetical protein
LHIKDWSLSIAYAEKLLCPAARQGRPIVVCGNTQGRVMLACMIVFVDPMKDQKSCVSQNFRDMV